MNFIKKIFTFWKKTKPEHDWLTICTYEVNDTFKWNTLVSLHTDHLFTSQKYKNVEYTGIVYMTYLYCPVFNEYKTELMYPTGEIPYSYKYVQQLIEKKVSECSAKTLSQLIDEVCIKEGYVFDKPTDSWIKLTNK